MGFDSITGHTTVIKALVKAIQSGRIASSYIFEGPEGVGKFATALAMANAVACSLDIKVFQTDEKTIKIEDIRRLRGDINIVPSGSGRKVYIVRDAEKMTAEAQNAFLKVLEEPPSYGVIVLTCNSLSSLLPTIRSRCIVFHFGPLSKKDIADILVKSHGIHPTKAAFAASLSGGSVSRALAVSTSAEFDEIREVTWGIFCHVLDKQMLKSIEDVEKLQSRQDHIDDILNLLQLWYMDLIYAKLGMYDIISNGDKLEEAKSISLRLSLKALVKSIKLIEQARRRINKYVNFFSTMEDMVIGLQELV
ncbi:DNA polymerase III subunit [Caldanaerobius polysaccharolyticus]|uniref:DNA polymerase III subunit n=1 Tax=Caldanaerobius polysaccharolyticus TaxID=44256 RepID=UPI0004799119|nr:DNA polymerase III subunit delta' C-terminal domain-containing protein [Caldanaerobius polysaccharolyticus]